MLYAVLYMMYEYVHGDDVDARECAGQNSTQPTHQFARPRTAPHGQGMPHRPSDIQRKIGPCRLPAQRVVAVSG